MSLRKLIFAWSLAIATVSGIAIAGDEPTKPAEATKGPKPTPQAKSEPAVPPNAKPEEKPEVQKLAEELDKIRARILFGTREYDKTFAQQEKLEASLRLATQTRHPSIFIESKQAALATVEQELVKAEVTLIETESRKDYVKAMVENAKMGPLDMIPIITQPKIVAHLKEHRAKLQEELLKETQPSPEAEQINEEFHKLLEERQKLAKEMKELSERQRAISQQIETLSK